MSQSSQVPPLKKTPIWEQEGEEFHSPRRTQDLLQGSLKDFVPRMPKHEAVDMSISLSDFKNRQALKEKLMKRMLPPTFKTAANGKMEYYDHERLLSWQALFIVSQSVFADKRVWMTGIYMMTMSMVTALVLVLFCPSARRFKTENFAYFVTFLKVFIVFMLGIYLNKSFKRWWSAVMAFKSFLTAIKQLMFTLYAIDVSPDTFAMIERYSIASAYILNTEVNNAQHIDNNEGLSDEYHMFHLSQTFDFLEQEGILEADEISELVDVREETGGHIGILTTTLWSWIGVQVDEVKKSAEEAKVALPPPLHLRLLILCQTCIKEVEELKTNVIVQMPYTYAHLLAFLVHTYNTLLALTCGVAFGSAAAEVLVRRQQMTEHPTASVMGDLTKELYGAVQVMGVQFLIVLIEPVLYQAFLHIAHALCYPFGNQSYHLPIETFIAQLHLELAVMARGKQNHKAIMTDPDTIAGSRRLSTLAAGKKPSPRKKSGAESSGLEASLLPGGVGPDLQASGSNV